MDLTIADIKELLGCTTTARTHSFQLGQCYFIRTVTYHATGRLESITDTDLVLRDAAWIASSGRFMQAIRDGELSEVEPLPDKMIISRGAIVDAFPWTHALPREQK